MAGGERHGSVLRRALLSLALLVSFYLLAVASALLAVPILGWIHLRTVNLLTLASAALGLGILRSLLPRRVRFEPPGLRIAPFDQPALSVPSKRSNAPILVDLVRVAAIESRTWIGTRD